MGDAAGLLVKAEDTPASVQIGITTLETGWYVKAVDPPSTPGPSATIRGVDKVGKNRKVVVIFILIKIRQP